MTRGSLSGEGNRLLGPISLGSSPAVTHESLLLTGRTSGQDSCCALVNVHPVIDMSEPFNIKLGRHFELTNIMQC